MAGAGVEASGEDVGVPPWVVEARVVAPGVTSGVLPAGAGVEASGVDVWVLYWVVEATLVASGMPVWVLP